MRFPLFVDLRGKKAVVIGGGKIGTPRAEVLAAFGAEVTIISPSFLSKVSDGIKTIKKEFEPKDLEGTFLAVAATNNRQINRQIYEICTQKGIFVSIADRSEECTFYFPAICLNDRLCIGVVSHRGEHGLVKNTAKKIRELISHEN